MAVEAEDASATESNRISKRQGWLLVGALLVLSLVLFFVDFSPRAVAARQVVAADGFQPVAVLSNVELLFAPGLGEKTAVFIGTLTPDDDPNLIAIDLTNGETQWQVTGSEQFHPYFWPEEWLWEWPLAWNWGPVVVADDQVIVADSFALTTSVNSFDITSGELGWQRTIGDINGSDIGYLAVADENAIAVGIDVEGYSEFQMLDLELGFRQFRRSKDVDHIFWVEPEPLRVFEAFANQVRATGDNGWQQSVTGCDGQPVMLADRVVMTTSTCDADALERGQPRISALSRIDGMLLWQLSQEVVSNLAVDANRIVGLTADANLLILDVNSGNELGRASFAPLEFGANRNFFVAIRDEIVAVYFGDSQELIFMRFS